ncbi:uncharacterized protein LY79DRAFT_547977 [Colletotrichum navitas]|uniref:Secreted protein n=1 Tax=Colletotrichum navitas TaxID=681940 RepID=A0AAD8V5K7_9PEZI|nr:uncharacterized protein LY79DRAFT_547977 [Colletotrichum navitas]KAK1595067.1 hypothetical protein LY79DRAFT_547977 [Colletotrichum navitas]
MMTWQFWNRWLLVGNAIQCPQTSDAGGRANGPLVRGMADTGEDGGQERLGVYGSARWCLRLPRRRGGFGRRVLLVWIDLILQTTSVCA